MYLYIIKVIYDKSIANFKLNGEKLKQFPLKSGMRFNIVLEFLHRAIWQEELIKGIQVGKETAKVFADNMILKTQKTPPKNS
jgi:hypothetical protein